MKMRGIADMTTTTDSITKYVYFIASDGDVTQLFKAEVKREHGRTYETTGTAVCLGTGVTIDRRRVLKGEGYDNIKDALIEYEAVAAAEMESWQRKIDMQADALANTRNKALKIK